MSETDRTAPATAGDRGRPRTEPSPSEAGARTEPGAASHETPAVTIEGFRFLPDSLTATTGAQVQWQNEDTGPHTGTTGTPEARTDLLDMRLPGAGGTAELTFDEPGSYSYFCDIHPSMRGEIVVERPDDRGTARQPT